MTSDLDVRAETVGPERDLGRCALALDVGGTKLAAGLVTDAGDIIAWKQLPTPIGGPEELFDALAAVTDSVLHAAGVEVEDAGVLSAIGLATAAPMDLDAGTVSPVNIPGWRNFPIRDRLHDRYGLDVQMIGDAVAVAVAEHWRGAARGRRNVLGMVVSTGVGGGLIVDGQVVSGTTGNAGQIGHISVDPFGPTCVCGGTGCLEAVASGRSIAHWASTHGLTGAANARQVAAAARRGDPVALATFRRAGEALGLAIAGVVTLLDLDVAVIGGGVARAGAILFDPVADGYAKYAALGYAASPRVVPAVLGTEAGLIGAGAAALRSTH